LITTQPSPSPASESPVPPPLPLPPTEPPPRTAWWRRVLLGNPKDLADRRVFHSIALIPFLAWVGLGADGLSSSAYGPAEAFITLGEHTYLALALAVAVAFTVLVISSAYSRILVAFPQGGGGYVVASKLLSPHFGVVSGCALLIDYVLTIAVSIAASGDAIFSLLPVEWVYLKLPLTVTLILILITLNLRGVKESVIPLVPVFVLFLVTHAVLLVAGIVEHVWHVGDTATKLRSDFNSGLSTIGLTGMVLLFFKAYSLGAGTYTGIEAVSNGLTIMREPRVQTGLRTMRYMSISLAVTASGLLICFLLTGVTLQEGKTLNASLAENVSAGWPGGAIFVLLVLVSEAALLTVAAQAGFIDGPRVLANMALDGWMPRKFASLSDRLTQHNGIVLMGSAALIALIATGGSVHVLVLMYAINVFITFSLTMASMIRYAWRGWGQRRPHARRDLALFIVGFIMCMTILVVTCVEKFHDGGWVTITVTGTLIALCFLIQRHYRSVAMRVAQLQRDLKIPDKAQAPAPPPFDPSKPIAAILVGGYSGLGVHTLISAMSSFGGYFKNAIFVSVGVIDSGAFKGEAELDALATKTRQDLEKYVELANRLGVAAQSRYSVGLDLVDELEKLCIAVQKEYPRASFFAGQLTFQQQKWFDSLLHNQTAFNLQRRLHWAGIPMLILPIRVK